MGGESDTVFIADTAEGEAALQHPAWIHFSTWANANGVNSPQEADWLSHWQCWVDGYAVHAALSASDCIEAEELELGDLTIGDKVAMNAKTWVPNDFDSWGRGAGIGEVVEVFAGGVDVRWPKGRCYEPLNQLRKATPMEKFTGKPVERVSVEKYLESYRVCDPSPKCEGLWVPLSVAHLAAELFARGKLELKQPSWISGNDGNASQGPGNADSKKKPE